MTGSYQRTLTRSCLLGFIVRLALPLMVIIAKAHSHPIRHAKHHHDQEIQADQGEEKAYVLLTISEINVDSASTPAKRFIELSMQRLPGQVPAAGESLLRGWRLLLIKGSTMEIIMSTDLSLHFPASNAFHIVIGDDKVPNVHMTFQNENTQAAFSPITFPDLDNSPYAIVLLGAMDAVSSEALSLQRRGGAFQSLAIADDEYRMQLISDLAWDVAVVGRRVPTNQCDFFTSLFPSRSFTEDFKYLLRDRDSAASSVNDYSLNYCCNDPLPYSPACFKLGHPSPGLNNDCTGKRFILEFEINEIAQSRQSSLFVDQNEAFCRADFPGVEPYRYNSIHDHDYSAAVARVMQKDDCTQRTDAMEIDEPLEPNGDVSALPPDQKPMKYVADFDLAEFQKCRHHFWSPDSLLGGMYTPWLHLQHLPDKCLITCRVCKLYFKSGWRPDQKHKSNIQKNGYFSSNKYANQRAVNNHMKDRVHAEAAFFYGQLALATTRSEQLTIEALQETREKKRLKPTTNEVDIGYTEIQSGVSFSSHGDFMNLADHLEVDVGFKHRNEDSLSQLSYVLSSAFHKRLLQHLVNEQRYFSLICDGTTNRNIPYLVCLIQTLEDSQPIVYFWGLLVITAGESGYSMVEDLKIRISEDDATVPGFEEFFKTHIIASVSDSASNMAGSRNSFYVYLSRYVGRNLALIKCGAHKLQRAIIHAIDFPTDEPSASTAEKDRKRYFKSFAHINNKFYTFYMSRGSKRFQEFIELAEELEIPAYRINYFFDVRWAASHKKCMDTMYKNYDALRADLNRISKDPQFDKTGKAKAAELYKHLVDKTFPVVVAEFADFLAVFEIMSLRFQSKGGIMIGNVGIIREGFSDFETLKNEPGSYLQAFLNKCSCTDVCSKGTCLLADYDNCPEVIKDDSQKLTTRTDGEHTINLGQFRTHLYENIQKQLVEYFDVDKLEAFEVFNPKNFKMVCSATSGSLSCENLSSCYNVLPTVVSSSTPKSPEANIRILCEFYGIPNSDQIIQQWKEVIVVIIGDYRSQNIQQLDAAQYWPKQIQRTDLHMAKEIRSLLERILVTSFTSADAERAFSMVSNIKTPDRSNLSPKSLENLVRVRFNGPAALTDANLYAYTKEFVRKTSRVDDASVVGGQKPRPDAYKSYFSKSKLF